MSKGLLLGVLRVYVYGRKVKVGDFMDEPFVIDEVQNYIGEEILLHDNNGNFSAAPEQDPEVSNELTVVTMVSSFVNEFVWDVTTMQAVAMPSSVTQDCDNLLGGLRP